MGRKTCTKCGEEKPLDDFYFDRGRPRANCKECHRAAVAARRASDPEATRAYSRAWHAKHRERRNAESRKRWAENAEEINARRRQDRAKDPEKYRKQKREWWAQNRERISEYRRAWWKVHGPRIREAIREDRKRNPEKYRRLERNWRAKNREKRNAAMREYYARNRHLWEKSRAARRARLAGVEHQPYTRREIYDRDGGRCKICGCDLAFEPHGFHIDHIVPISLGGPDTPANVQLTCRGCNQEKWAHLEGQIYLPV